MNIGGSQIDTYKALITKQPEGAYTPQYLIRLVLEQPGADSFIITKVLCRDWFVKAAIDGKFFIAAMSESYVIAESFIVDSVECIKQAPGENIEYDNHTVEHVFDRMYDYCKDQLQATQNSLKLNRLPKELKEKYIISRMIKKPDLLNLQPTVYAWEYLSDYITQLWVSDPTDPRITTFEDKKGITEYLDYIDLALLEQNDVYITRYTPTIVHGITGYVVTHTGIMEYIGSEYIKSSLKKHNID